MAALQVDVDALLTMANALDAESDTIRGLEPGDALVSATDALRGSAVGGAVGRAGAPLTAAYDALANCLRRMAEGTARSAEDYDAAEKEFGLQLRAVGRASKVRPLQVARGRTEWPDRR